MGQRTTLSCRKFDKSLPERVYFLVLEPHLQKRQAFKPLNRCAPFKPTSALRVQVEIPATLRLLNRFWIFDPSALLRACPESIEGTGFGFWIPTESALKSKNHLAMCRFEFQFAFDRLDES